MNVLSIVWPGFPVVRRICRKPFRYVSAGLRACGEHSRDVEFPGFGWLAWLVMFTLLFGFGAAALVWPAAMAALFYSAHIGQITTGSAASGMLILTGVAYTSLFTHLAIEL